jgi:hypothetical protein
MNHIYKNGFAIGYLLGDKEVLFAAPIPINLLMD